MLMLTEEREIVIGVDTHRDTLSAAVIDPVSGGVHASLTVPTTPSGYDELISWAHERGRVRVWAIEGTRTYGTGITRALITAGETVSEADRPKRPKRRAGKDDVIDAIRAGREALGHDRIAPPRQGEVRDAIAVYLIVRRSAVSAAKVAKTQLRAMIVTAPDGIRTQVRETRKAATWHACRQLHISDNADTVTVATVTAMKLLAVRIIEMDAEADRLERAIRKLIMAWKPTLLERCGVGTIGAATLLCAWSHPGRFRSEAAFVGVG
jgi:transposase